MHKSYTKLFTDFENVLLQGGPNDLAPIRQHLEPIQTRLNYLFPPKIDPTEAGELLANYIASQWNRITERTRETFDLPANDASLVERAFETTWELQFWRTLALEGADVIKKQIKDLS